MIAVELLPERNCATCTDRQRKEWGCEAKQNKDGTWVNPAALPMMIDGKEDYACPRQPILQDPVGFDYLFTTFSLFNEGVLPDPGGLNDQANKWVESIRCIRAAHSETKKQKADAQKRKAGRRNRQAAIGRAGRRRGR